MNSCESSNTPPKAESQSKMNAVSAAVRVDSAVKLAQVVPIPAKRKPPTKTKAALFGKEHLRELIINPHVVLTVTVA